MARGKGLHHRLSLSEAEGIRLGDPLLQGRDSPAPECQKNQGCVSEIARVVQGDQIHRGCSRPLRCNAEGLLERPRCLESLRTRAFDTGDVAQCELGSSAARSILPTLATSFWPPTHAKRYGSTA